MLTKKMPLHIAIPGLVGDKQLAGARCFTIFASVFGGATGIIRSGIACQWDWPVDPTDEVLLEIIYALSFAVRKLANLILPK
jgi:hypothetical protein